MTTITHTELELTGIEGIDGCWALDRFSHPQLGLTRTALVLSRAKVAGMGPAAAQLGDRMGSVALRRRLPDDVVVVAVPSAAGLSDELAARVAEALERPTSAVLGVRHGLLGRLDGSVRGRIRAKGRRAPAHVLLVDDSVGSGETLRSCAAMLRERGARQVWAVVAVASLEAAPPA